MNRRDPATPTIDSVACVDSAIEQRRSIRAFLSTPVSPETVKDILRVASRAPSGTNIQPWKVYVLTGAAKDRLSRDLLAAHDDPEASTKHRHEQAYYPSEWPAPYSERRKALGVTLYRLLGLTRENKRGMRHQHGRNLTFFDAPVGMIFSISRRLHLGSWIDYGCFLQNIAVAAQARGLGTCIQAAFAPLHQVVRENLVLSEDEMVVSGLSLGYPDYAKVENSLVSEREPVSAFADFRS
ncbi:nitroreductase [Variovorax sp. M-6]|uniref:nitroreductase n=1 Tax=Variovorax sp. M-6 TaxID=3233041 RepID=UPI003F9A4031